MANVPISEYERFINQVAADAHVTKYVLSAMIAKMAHARGTELLDDLQEVTKLAIQQDASAAAANPLQNRLHHLTASRADDYFRDLRGIVRMLDEAAGRTRQQ